MQYTISEHIVVSANYTAKLLVGKELTKVGSFGTGKANVLSYLIILSPYESTRFESFGTT